MLEGETLRTRLRSGPLEPRKVVEIDLQIARGLAAAHAKGVVHRDLKPDNLFLTTDEHIKILDFGIAKLKADSASDDVTIGTSGHDTKAGIVVGTVGYMSPEQVRGESLDHRSDLFAVGAILYELVTGRRAFQAETVSETMTAILRDDPPPVSEIVPIVPPAFEAILAHCLVKDRSSRVQSALDLAFDIELVSMLSDRSAPARDAAAPAAGSRRRPALVGLGLIVAAATGLLFGRTFAPAPSRSSAVGVHRLTDLTGLEEYPSLSPDRKYVAFTADADGARQIWVRLLSGGSPLRLTTGAADHLFPRWAPDSGSIVYFSSTSKADSSGSLWEVSALGGAARKIACSLGGADVSHDGRLAFFRLNNDRPERAIAGPDGSGIETVVVLEAGFVYQTPRWSPDGSKIAFERRYLGQGGTVYVADIASKRATVVLSWGPPFMGLAWLPNGRGLVFSSSRGSTIPYLPTSQLWSAEFGDDEWLRWSATAGSIARITFWCSDTASRCRSAESVRSMTSDIQAADSPAAAAPWRCQTTAR